MNSKSMTELVAEHRDSLAALTQRIGEQNGLLNLQDAERVVCADLLRKAAHQINALNSELHARDGGEATRNVVAVMIEEWLMNSADNSEQNVEWEDITDPEYVLQASDELNSKDNDKDSGWLTCEYIGRVGQRLGDVGNWCVCRRRKPIAPAVSVSAVVPCRCPKCGKDLDFYGDCEFCDKFVTHRPPQERKDEIEHSDCYYDTDRNK